MSDDELNAEKIRALLLDLAGRLKDRGIDGDIRLVGGAALILQDIGARPTADIDASYTHRNVVNGVAADMAAEYGLARDWLNANSTAFVPDGATWVDLEQLGGLKVRAADAETLLAMKIAAERGKDIPDIARLMERLGITDPEEAVDLAYVKYGDYSIPLAAGRDNYLIVVEDAIAAGPGIGVRSPGGAPPAGGVWVAPHVRDGRHVEGHFRRRPGS